MSSSSSLKECNNGLLRNLLSRRVSQEQYVFLHELLPVCALSGCLGTGNEILASSDVEATMLGHRVKGLNALVFFGFLETPSHLQSDPASDPADREPFPSIVSRLSF